MPYQSAIIFFLILYAYLSPTSRPDGYDTYLYEFSTVSTISPISQGHLPINFLDHGARRCNGG